MKRNRFDTSVIETEVEDGKPKINQDALDLNIDELAIEKKYYFSANNESLSIFKEENEPYIHAFTKAMAFYIYKNLYPSLQIDPPVYRKYKADLIAFSFTNEPIVWIECFERDYEKIEYVCRHMHVEELILIELTDNINPYLQELRKKVHYKYHHLISVVNFIPEIIYYVSPSDIYISPDWYHITELAV